MPNIARFGQRNEAVDSTETALYQNIFGGRPRALSMGGRAPKGGLISRRVTAGQLCRLLKWAELVREVWVYSATIPN